VSDGDTVALRNGQRVRLVQIDTPEVFFGVECYGLLASLRTKQLLQPGTRVRLFPEPVTDRVDQYGRLLRYVVCVRDGVNVNIRLACSSKGRRPVFDSLASELNHFRGRCFVGGDFNLSRGFDASYRLSGDRSHGGFFAWLDSEHSLVECCCADGEKRSLYRRGRAHADYQLDHLFVSRRLAESRGACTVRDWSVGGLSDHAPVVGVFAVAAA
jgi:endonuclease/exonuclease/phosphatase family metal-dependent hydrolase